jgi:hypothetical protein
MGFALVSAGEVAYGNPNYTGEIAPSFGASTGAGHLLVACLYSGSSDATNPYTCEDDTWAQVEPSDESYNWSDIWYKEDCGAGEAPPVFGLSDSTTSAGMLLEFSGGATAGALDQDGGPASSGETLSASAGGPDGGGGRLLVFAGGWNGGSGATTIVNSATDSSGASVSLTSYNDPDDTTGFKYSFFWGVCGEAGGEADSCSSVLGVYSGGGCSMATFKPGGAGPAAVPALAWAAVV